MKDLDIRIALAEVEGVTGPWTFCDVQKGTYFTNPKGQHLLELTLDWLHEIETKLNFENNEASEWSDYQQTLWGIVNPGINFDCEQLYDVGYLCNLMHATKHQRAEAILRVLGKWRE